MGATTVWVGDVDHLRQGCFHFYFRNASTFTSLHGRRALEPSLRAHGATAQGDTGLFSLTLLADGLPVRLIAHLRRVKPRRQSARPVKASKPPARDPRQGSLF